MASQHWLVTLLGLITVSAANLLPASSTLDEAAAQPALAVQLAGPSEATPRTLAVVDFDSENLETDDLASINQSLAAAFSGRSDLSVQPLTSTRSRLVEAGFLPHDPYKPAPSASSLA